MKGKFNDVNLSDFEILPIRLDEVQSLSAFAIQIFLDSYAHLNTPENMQAYLDKAFSIKQLTKELQESDSLFFFAKRENEILGYLKVNLANAQTDINDPKSLEIERIYVAQKYQGQKIGRALMDKAKEIGAEQDLDYLWLGVWRKNPNAISFYQKIGFVSFDTHTFHFGTEEQVDVLMKLERSPNKP